MRTRFLAALTAIALVVAGCSPGEEQGERSRLGKKDDKKSEQQDKKKKKNDKKPAGEVAEGNVDEAVGGDSGPGTTSAPGAPSLGDEDTPRSGIDPSLADASSRVEEPGSDAKKNGLPPGYAELLSAEIQGLGDTFRFTMTFDGDVPQQLPKDTYMVLGLGVTGRQEDEGFAFGINGDEKRWRPYAGGKGGSSDFPGTFEIRGNQVILVLPWSSVEGPRAFDWYANASWFSQIAGQTRYSFDPIPNEEAARFPN